MCAAVTYPQVPRTLSKTPSYAQKVFCSLNDPVCAKIAGWVETLSNAHRFWAAFESIDNPSASQREEAEAIASKTYACAGSIWFYIYACGRAAIDLQQDYIITDGFLTFNDTTIKVIDYVYSALVSIDFTKDCLQVLLGWANDKHNNLGKGLSQELYITFANILKVVAKEDSTSSVVELVPAAIMVNAMFKIGTTDTTTQEINLAGYPLSQK